MRGLVDGAVLIFGFSEPGDSESLELGRDLDAKTLYILNLIASALSVGFGTSEAMWLSLIAFHPSGSTRFAS